MAYIKANNIPGSPSVKSGSDYTSFVYKKTIMGTKYSYETYIFENGDEYWLINFSCYTDVWPSYKKIFKKAADSVEFIKD